MPASARDNTTHGNMESLRDEESVSCIAERESLNCKGETRGEVAREKSDSDSSLPEKISTAEKKKDLTTLLAEAVQAAEPDAGDEGRFWAAVDVLAKIGGLPRSQLVKLGKVIGEHDEALAVLRTVAAAKAPQPYLAKIIRNRELETRQTVLARAGLADEPEFVSEFRRDGYSPIYRRPDGNWEVSRWTYTPDGVEIGA